MLWVVEQVIYVFASKRRYSSRVRLEVFRLVLITETGTASLGWDHDGSEGARPRIRSVTALLPYKCETGSNEYFFQPPPVDRSEGAIRHALSRAKCCSTAPTQAPARSLR